MIEKQFTYLRVSWEDRLSKLFSSVTADPLKALKHSKKIKIFKNGHIETYESVILFRHDSSPYLNKQKKNMDKRGRGKAATISQLTENKSQLLENQLKKIFM